MSDKGETPTPTPMDSKIDKSVKIPSPPTERVEPIGEGKAPIAAGRQPPTETAPTKLSSWTMSEIERMITNSVLKKPEQSLDNYAIGMNQKSDFRLKGLLKQYKTLLANDYQKETDQKLKASKVREFDLESQTLRMVTANASLGAYQFQKNLVLPFMRKQLALGYQKVNLLKDIVSGIGSLEKAVVAKLEAIKLNTAATAPKHQTWWQKVVAEKQANNRTRIAQNLSNMEMDFYDRIYRKWVTPTTSTLWKAMNKGGVNKTRSVITDKFNKWRHQLDGMAEEAQPEGETPGFLDKMKQKGARIGSKVLKKAIPVAHKVKLGSGLNTTLGKLIAGSTLDYAKLNPFAVPGTSSIDLEEDERTKNTDTVEIGEKYKYPDKAVSILAQSFDEWRGEYRTDTDTSLGYLSAIVDSLSGGSPPSSPSSPQGPDSPAPVAPKPNTPKRDIPRAPIPVSPPKPITISDKIASIEEQSESPKLKTPSPDRTDRKVTTIGDSVRKARVSLIDRLEAFAKGISPLALSTVPQMTPAMAGTGTSGFPDRDFFKDQFSQLGDKVKTVTETVDLGNKSRSKFEKLQTKWRELTERLQNKKDRKNSYEDIQEQKEKEKEKKGFLRRGAEKTVQGAKGFAANLADGNPIGAVGSLLAALGGWALEESMGLAGKGIMKGGGLLLKGLGGAGKWAVGKALGRKAVGAAAGNAKPGLLKSAGSMLWKGAKSTAMTGARGLGSVALKGGLAIGGGMAGSAISDFSNENLEGGWKRTGNTVGKMAEYASYGSMFGPYGIAIGAGLGAIVANSDLLVKGLKKTASGISWLGESALDAGKGIWTGIFGQKAIVNRRTGKVKREEKQSIFGNLRSSIWGRDAKYSKSGEVIRSGKTGLVPYVVGGVSSFIFGKEYDPKKWENKSLLYSLSDDIKEIFANFKEEMMSIPGKIMDGLSWIKDKARDLAGSVGDGVQAAANWVANKIQQYSPQQQTKRGNIYKGGGTPVADGASVVSQLLPQATVTSSYRPPSHPLSKANPGSWHSKSKAAVDVKPIPGMDFEQFKKVFTDNGYRIIEAINEDNAGGGKQTAHATGNHWHIVLGQGTPLKQGTASMSTAAFGATSVADNWGKALGSQGGGAAMGSLAGTGSISSQGSWSMAGGSNYASGSGQFGGGGTAPAAMADKFASVVNYLTTRHGFSRNAAIGIAANLYRESKLDPTAHNPDDKGKPSYGLVQWRDGRVSDIERKFGKKILNMSMQEQLDAMVWEMKDGKHVTSSNKIPGGKEPFLQALNNSPNWQSAVQQVVYRYERPGNMSGEVNVRIGEASALVAKLGNLQQQQLAQQTAAKPKTTPAPKAASKPAKESPNPIVSGMATLTGSLNDFNKSLSSYQSTQTASAASTKGTKSSGSTIVAPITIAAASGKASKPSTTMSMSKTSVRTGA